MKISQQTLTTDKANREALLDLSEAHSFFAKIYKQSKNYQQAIESYLRVEKICHEIYQKDKSHYEAVYRTGLVYTNLSKIYNQTGNQSLAQEYQIKADKSFALIPK